MKNNTERKRELHYDLLRIISAFSVVILHCAAQYWYDLDIYGMQWMIANSYDAIFRFGVPVFVMISGALFLAPEYKLDIKRLYKHNILRMVVIYVLWSGLYGLWDCRYADHSVLGIKDVLREMMGGRYHLWFLPMIIGIYMILPILKGWIERAGKKQIEYILILFFVVQILNQTIRALTVTDELQYILKILDVELICSYVGYFILGYYLAHIGIGPKLKRFLYIALLPSVICNVVLGNYLSHRSGVPTAAIYDSFGLFTFITVTALFVFAKDKWKKASYGKAGDFVVKELSADMLGVYVMHIGVIEVLEIFGIHSMMMNNVFAIPLLAIICFAICTLLSSLLRRIPFIGRYIC